MSSRAENKSVHVTAPCRLHFGLINCGVESPELKSFGGIGAMVDDPCIQISTEHHRQLEITGDNINRVRQFTKQWFEFAKQQMGLSEYESFEQLPIKIKCQSPKNHIGLGIGTQLALTTATSLCHHFELPTDTDQLARLLDRGRRSAIGIQGFKNGGFIFESGKSTDDEFGELEFQKALNPQWRAVLVMNDETVGVHGAVEEDVFRNPVYDPKISEELEQMIRGQIVPAVKNDDFQQFSQLLYHYGQLSGSLFADQQGGAYNGQVVEKAVAAVRAAGIVGVGQSSWGPTVFAITESHEQAEDLVKKLETELPRYEFIVARFNRDGAKVTIQ